MILDEEKTRLDAVLAAAREAMTVARTAPKTRGRDNLVIKLADGEDLERIAAAMDEETARNPEKRASFARDAKNVRASQAVVLVGAKLAPIGLDCGWCGFPNCAEKGGNPAAPCAFNVMDLGIAIGSVGSLLGRKHVDNRVMFSIGVAAMALKLFAPEVTTAIGVPLSVSGKSPYFDRK